MSLKRKLIFSATAFLFAATIPLFAQQDEEEEDEKKMIREVVEIQVDRPPAAPVVVPETPTKGKKKKVEEPPPEVAPVDSGGTMPAPASELKKRGHAWMHKKTKEYVKKDPVESGNNLECYVSFNYKPKELNPSAPSDGTVSMKVIIECKEGKYRYTIKDIKHTATNGKVSGGDVYSDIPACGTMVLPDPEWKRIKSFGLQRGAMVAAQLKEFMKEPVKSKKDAW
jgi:hypothetical protein